MKTLRIILAATLLGVPALNAQLVADGATNTLSNVTTNIPGSVTVGANGSFTLLVLSNNCLVTNSGVGAIGQNTTAILVKQANGFDIITKSDLIYFLTRQNGDSRH